MTTFTKADLTRALEFAARATARKSTMPILSCVLLDDDDGAQVITGTDLDVAAVAHATPTDGAPVTACVDARTLLAVVKALPDGDVTLAMGDGLLSGQPLTVSGGRARTTLQTQPPADYPKVPERPDGIRLAAVPPEDWSAAYAAVRDAVSREETRYVLNGVRVDGDTWVSTDGHRLHAAPGPAIGNVILPRAALAALDAVVSGGRAFVGVTDSHVHATSDAGSVVARLVEGRFPDWRQVVPSAPPTWTVRVVADDLLAALARVQLATGSSGMVRLDATGGALALSAETPGGAARDEVEAKDATGAGRIAVRGEYLRDAVRAVGGVHVVIKATDELSPLLIHADGMHQDHAKRAVVMPMRM